MALNLGELVAGLRADETDFVRGLDEAELALRNLTRDANGRLRDLHGQFVTESEVMGESLAYNIGHGARQAVAAIRKIGPAVLALGVGAPMVAGVTTAFVGLAAGAVSAGLAVAAFQSAVKPQLEDVAKATTAAEKAEDAHATATRKKAAAQALAKKGGEEYKTALREAESASKAAKEADAAYKQELDGLPPATREYAEALQGLKKDHESWSAELSKDTMPVFTKGVNILRDLLPTLTPFVQAAAKAIGGFLDEVAVGVKSAGFKQWAADMAQAAGPALSNFLTVIKNFAVGFGGLMQAFLPASDNATGGLVRMSDAFAQWATSLKGSEGFAQFLDLARQGGTTLAHLAIAAGQLLVAFGPLIGITTQIALALAKVINALPPEVLTVLATTIGAVAIGMKVYAAYSALAAVANRVLASSTYLAIAGWARMMAVGLMAYARIAAAAVASAARTAAAWVGSALASIGTWIAAVVRAAVTAVAQFAMMAARAVVWAATMAAQWLIAMGPIGWVIAAVVGLVALVIANWDKVKAVTVAAWGYIVGFVRGAATGIIAGVMLLAKIPGMVLGFFGRMKDSAVRKASELVSWMRGLPGRISSAIGSLAGLLVGKGKDVIRGLWNGISSMGGWLWSKIKSFVSENVVDAVKGFLLIGSPSKLMADQVGRWIPAGVAQGVTSNAGVLDKAMTSLVSTPTPSAAMAMGIGAGGAASAAGGRIVTLRGGDAWGDQIIELIRDRVGIGGGDVQLYLGK